MSTPPVSSGPVVVVPVVAAFVLASFVNYGAGEVEFLAAGAAVDAVGWVELGEVAVVEGFAGLFDGVEGNFLAAFLLC